LFDYLINSLVGKKVLIKTIKDITIKGVLRDYSPDFLWIQDAVMGGVYVGTVFVPRNTVIDILPV